MRKESQRAHCRFGSPNVRYETNVVNHMWKEMYSPDDYKTDNDPLGADGVILTLNVETLVAHRIQVKMGKGKEDEQAGKRISGRLTRMRPTAIWADCVTGLILAKTRSILFHSQRHFASCAKTVGEKQHCYMRPDVSCRVCLDAGKHESWSLVQWSYFCIYAVQQSLYMCYVHLCDGAQCVLCAMKERNAFQNTLRTLT